MRAARVAEAFLAGVVLALALYLLFS